MIAVIADDITGAAELAGIGLNNQLKTELNTIVEPTCNADLLIIAANTRSLPVAEAKRITADITRQLIKLNPQLIFKKIDSVLRGHVLDEVHSQLEASSLKRALIVPGNPSLGKKIIDGVYYYNDEPIHKSNHSCDPEFPVRSSHVKEMLRAECEIHVLKNHEHLPDTGIIIGEATVEADFNRWVEKIDQHTLIAGAAGLFNSLLHHLKPAASIAFYPEKEIKTPRLFVFGSAFNKGRQKIKNGLLNNIPIIYIPEDIIFSDDLNSHLYQNFNQSIVTVLKESSNCIMAIDNDTVNQENIDPRLLAIKMGMIVKSIHQQINLHHLLIEGGATAAAILSELGISKLYPVNQIAPGAIRLGVSGNNQLYVTLKPGSYEWPAAVWQIN